MTPEELRAITDPAQNEYLRKGKRIMALARCTSEDDTVTHQEITEFEAHRDAYPSHGATCPCRDVQPCGCSVGVPVYAQMQSDKTPLEPQARELYDAVLSIVTEFNRLPYGFHVPREVAAAINRAEDVLQKIAPVPF